MTQSKSRRSLLVAALALALPSVVAAQAAPDAPRTTTVTLQGSVMLLRPQYQISYASAAPSMVVGVSGNSSGDAAEFELFSVALLPGASLAFTLPSLSIDASTVMGEVLPVDVSIRGCVSNGTLQPRCFDAAPDEKGVLHLDVGALLSGAPAGSRLTVYADPVCSSEPGTPSGLYAGSLALHFANPAT